MQFDPSLLPWTAGQPGHAGLDHAPLELQVSGGLGQAFDEDPKRWRMIAEAFTTTGYAMEIGTALFPQNFVLLAGELHNFVLLAGELHNFVLLAGELVVLCCRLLLGCVASCAACAFQAD